MNCRIEKTADREVVENIIGDKQFCHLDEDEAILISQSTCKDAILMDKNNEFAIIYVDDEPETFFAINDENIVTMFNMHCDKSFCQIKSIIKLFNEYKDRNPILYSDSAYIEARRFLKKIGFSVYKTHEIIYEWKLNGQ